MRYLVTGATGFLGQHIVERLVAGGHTVRGFCRRELPELKELGVELVLGDLRSAEDCRRACRGVDAVFHTAAQTGISLRKRPFYEVNVDGTRHILDAAIASGVTRLVYTGSPSVADAGQPLEGVTESAGYPETYLADYPKTKAIAEKMVLEANGTALSGGKTLLTCSLRPRLIWGPRDRNLIPRIIERARAGRLRRVGDGTNRLDTIYVENAADAHLLAMEALTDGSPVAGSAYFLSQGDPVNCWEFIDRVLAMVGLGPVRKSISFKNAWRLGLLCEWGYRLLGIRKEPPMTRFLATQLAFSYWFKTDRARRDFGFVPAVSNEEGLRRLQTYLRSVYKC